MVADIFDDWPSGLSAIKNDEYDLIIPDRMLPGGLDGLDICRQIRDSGIKTPIILLTAKGNHDKVEGLNAGKG